MMIQRPALAVVLIAAAGFTAAPLPTPPVAAPPANAAAPDDVDAAWEAFVSAEHWREAKAAGEALVAFGGPAAKRLRRGAEHHADEAVRRRCYEVLIASFPTDPSVLRTIENDGLADSSRTIRYMCAFHLGEHRVFGAFRRLRLVVDSPDEDELTRYAAAKSLAELGEGAGLPLLYDGLGSDWYMPRYLSNLGIKAISGRDLGDFEHDFSEGAFVSGGVEARHPRRPVEDAERRAARFTAIAAWARWLRDARPELYKHLDGTW